MYVFTLIFVLECLVNGLLCVSVCSLLRNKKGVCKYFTFSDLDRAKATLQVFNPTNQTSGKLEATIYFQFKAYNTMLSE